MLRMIEIGAGGGSIARIGELGLPAVGPLSAGSDPGPACYRLGGEQPTVTDADLLLGYLDPQWFAGGSMTLDRAAAAAAYRDLARRLGVDARRAAWGIRELVDENMAAAARVHAAERGLDLRGYAMVATGGAGPVHACGVARRLRIGAVVVPPLAGVGSAFGLLRAPIAFDLTRSYLVRLDRLACDRLGALLDELEREGRSTVRAAGVAEAAITVERTADLRYVGQGYEIRVQVPPGPVDRALVDSIRRSFEEAYVRFYGRLSDGVPLEAVNWRVVVAGPALDLRHLPPPAAPGERQARPVGRRPVLFDPAHGAVDTPVYRRAGLAAEFAGAGPAIIEEAECTTVVPPDWRVRVHANGCLILRAGGAP